MNKFINIEKILKTVFGEIGFFEIKHFFQNIHTKDVDIIIFTTRRSHLLYCMFRKYFFSNVKPKCKHIIDDKAIHFYSKEIKNKSCLIADDIMIHGSALQNIIERISEKKPKNIELYVYAMGKESSVFNNSYSGKIFCIKKSLERREWEYLSNQIVAALLLTSTSYASYIFSFSKNMSMDQFNKLISNMKVKYTENKIVDLSLEEVDNDSLLGNIIRKNIIGYIFNATDYTNGNNLHFSCFRVYYNKILEKCIIISFVITKEMTGQCVNKVCDSIFRKNAKILKTNCIEAKYRAITSYYSFKLFGSEFKYKSWSTNASDICMSYYKGFYNDLFKKSFSPKIQSNLISHSNSNNYEIMNLDKDIYLQSFEILLNNPNELNIFFDTKKIDKLTLLFYKYLTYVNYSEEKYFKDQFLNHFTPEKQKGLSISVFNKLFNGNGKLKVESEVFSIFDFYSKFIESSDTGFLTIFIDKYKTENEMLYSNFFVKGEQVCRLYQNKYIIFICKLKFIYDNYQNHHKSSITFLELIDFCIDNCDEYYSEKINFAYNYLDKINFDSFILDSIYKNITDENLNLILMKGLERIKQANEDMGEI